MPAFLLTSLLLLLACTDDPGDDSGTPGDGADSDAALMDTLVGAWRSEVHYWTENDCPVDVTGPDYTGTGWYLLIEATAPTFGQAQLCADYDPDQGCIDRLPDLAGTVTVYQGTAQFTYTAVFQFFDDLQCDLYEEAVVDLVVDGDLLVMTTTAVVTVLGGAQCDETEARLQEESGLDYALEGCGGVQHNELARQD